MSASPLALMVPTWAIVLLSLVGGGQLLDLFDDLGHRHVDIAALERHGIGARFDELEALHEDGLGQYGGRRWCHRPPWSLCLRRDLAHHLRAHVLELAGQLDLLGDGDAVLGDDRRAVALFDDDVARPLGAEGDFATALARLLTPARMPWRAVRLYEICLALMRMSAP